MILFYDHLIDKTQVTLIIEKLDAPEEKKSKFKSMVDDILHTNLLEFILQKLHPHKHKTFLSQLDKAPYDPEILAYLRSHVHEDFENDIKVQAQNIIKLIIKDLQA